MLNTPKCGGQQFVRLQEKNPASVDTRWPLHGGFIRPRTQESLGQSAETRGPRDSQEQLIHTSVSGGLHYVEQKTFLYAAKLRAIFISVL